ncbi:MAG: hypothetical protein ABIJ83_00980 [Patescibacteria group bacterium]
MQELRKNYQFILIGGWAVFLYSHALKSKDIDIIVDYSELAKLKEKNEIFKNERLKKYEMKIEEFDVDIYLPHYSSLGIDINKIKEKICLREGFQVPELEILLILKLYAWENRRGSVKGQKDEIDIFSLAILSDFNWLKYSGLIKEFDLEKYHRNFIVLIKKTREIKELKINEQKMSKIRKNILQFIDAIDA